MVSQNLFGGVTKELIKLQSGNVTGAPGIQTALGQTKLIWSQLLVDAVDQQFTEDNVPYRTGTMYNHFKDRLHNYTAGQVHLGAPWSRYAGFVDAMEPPINWTRGGNRYHWFQRVVKFVEGLKTKLLRKAIRMAGLSASAGRSVGDLTEALKPE
jgi:hypothetical protein